LALRYSQITVWIVSGCHIRTIVHHVTIRSWNSSFFFPEKQHRAHFITAIFIISIQFVWNPLVELFHLPICLKWQLDWVSLCYGPQLFVGNGWETFPTFLIFKIRITTTQLLKWKLNCALVNCFLAECFIQITCSLCCA
jgi:hypothetical protein